MEVFVVRILASILILFLSTSASADFFNAQDTNNLYLKYGILTIGDLLPGEVAPVSTDELELCAMENGAIRLLGSTPILVQVDNEDYVNIRVLPQREIEITFVPISAATKFEMAKEIGRRNRSVIRCRAIPDLFWQNIGIIIINNIEGKTNVNDLLEHLENEGE